MEQLLHYVWKHKLFPLTTLVTTKGQEVEVIDPGLLNRNAGPDFFNAKVRIAGTMWVGNVEIHLKTSDWLAHHHNTDPAYDNVVLHVVEQDDGAQALCTDGKQPPLLVLPIPQSVRDNYKALLHEDAYPPCHSIIAELSNLTKHSWLSVLQTERLQQKAEAIMQRAKQCGADWERAFFITLARNFGFGINGDALEAWATNLSLDAAAHHRDDLFQIEALFLGQAGLLNVAATAAHRQVETAADDYFQRLSNEYAYLAHKFRLEAIDARQWRFLRLRPQNFPYIRLAQLAHLYHSRQCSLSIMADCTTVKELRAALSTKVTPYWQTHYTFGHEARQNEKRLSTASTDIIIINTVVPMLYAYGCHRDDERLCHRAITLLEQLKPEDNNIVRLWQQCGLKAENAADTQALIQLKRLYCDRKDCLRCRFGYEALKKGRNKGKVKSGK